MLLSVKMVFQRVFTGLESVAEHFLWCRYLLKIGLKNQDKVWIKSEKSGYLRIKFHHRFRDADAVSFIYFRPPSFFTYVLPSLENPSHSFGQRS